MLNLNLHAISGYIADVFHGREISVADRRARWTKVKNLKVGAKICVTAADFNQSFSPHVSAEVEFDEVVEIRKVGREQVYDIEVEGSRNFVGNGIVAHNTYISGNVGIGTTGPDQKLDVIGTIQASNLLGGAINLTTDASGNIIRDPSDARFKTNVEQISGALDKITQLRGVTYDWTEESNMGEGRSYGLIAQEVAQIIPGLVATSEDGIMGIRYNHLSGLLLEGIKEQQGQISMLSDTLTSLTGNPNVPAIDPNMALLTQQVDLLSQTVNDLENSIVNVNATDVTTHDIVSYTDTDTVEKATSVNANLLAGVVQSVDTNNATPTSNVASATSDVASASARIVTAGKARITVTNEHGDIKKGDLIAVSIDKPGFGMKALDAGMVIGVAMEDFLAVQAISPTPSGSPTPDLTLSPSPVATGSAETTGELLVEHSVPALQEGTIEVMVHILWYAGSQFASNQFEDSLSTTIASDSANLLASLATTNSPIALDQDLALYQDLHVLGATTLSDTSVTGKFNVGLVTIDGLGTAINATASTLKLQNEFGAGNIETFGGKIVMTTNGDIKVLNTVTAKKYIVDTSDSTSPSAGEAVIISGQTSITIETSALTDKSLIFVTPERPLIIGARKTETDTFIIELSETQPTDLKVSWWIIN